ncbi:Fic/DOC family protein [Campylobacter sp. MG1]|uniref:Fic/DOC family protein n=1 Tax=Campylobacter sp. MG1 TaxID=2976332 RepID=UPI00226CD713|nr:Fic family protein [Campylobacter sp. MG1]
MSDYFEELITKNKLGISDYKKFENASKNLTIIRAHTLIKNPIKGKFDYKHLKAIHKHIFQDVFSWAGKDRYELGLYSAMFKGNSMFCAGKFIPSEANRIFNNLAKKNYFMDIKNIDDFAVNLAEFLGDLNALHPFREGNGRTERIFVNELAKNAGFKLDLGLISQKDTIDASIKAMDCDFSLYENLIKAMLKENIY